MRNGLRAATMALAFGSLAAGAAAQPAGQPAGRERPGRMAWRADGPEIARRLGLSPEQSEQLKRLRSDERRQAIRRHADLAIARMDLEEALAAPTVDEKLVAARVKAVADLQAGEVRARADRRLALRRVLTPEQQQKLGELMRERRAERAGRWRHTGSSEPGR